MQQCETPDQAAAYFSALPNGTSLTASYTDSNDSSDVSGDAIVVNTPPTAVNNNRSIGVDKQAIGNVITEFVLLIQAGTLFPARILYTVEGSSPMR